MWLYCTASSISAGFCIDQGDIHCVRYVNIGVYAPERGPWSNDSLYHYANLLSWTSGVVHVNFTVVGRGGGHDVGREEACF